jgi:glycosyltransferase involved in cell wall biosynthesis
MNILHINTIDSEGGAAKIARQMHTSLLSDGWNSKFYVKIKKTNDLSIKKFKDTDFIKTISDQLLRITGKNLYEYLKNNLIKITANDIEWLKTTNFLKSKDYLNSDIVHFHNLHGNYFELDQLVTISQQKKTIWTIHDMWSITGHCCHSLECNRWKTGCDQCPYLNIYQSLSWDNSRYLWQKKKQIYKKSKLYIVVPSLWMKEKITKSILKSQPLYHIPNGVNIELFSLKNKSKLRNLLNLPQNKAILLFSAYHGKQNHWKGWLVVKKLLSQLKNSNNILILCIGGKVEDKLANTPQLIHLPKISNEKIMADYYAASDMLLFPSKAENLPLSILESMSCGTPVLAYDTGGINEIIQQGKNSFMVNNQDKTDFVRQVFDYTKLPEAKKKNIGNLARKTITNKFNLKKMLHSYKKLYQSIP